MSSKNTYREKPRCYFSEDLDICRWPQLESEFEKMLDRPIQSEQDWIELAEKSSELVMLVLTEYLQRMVKMKCHTDNPEYQENWNSYNTEVLAPVNKYEHRIYQKLDASPYCQGLPERYRMMQAIITREMSTYREENVALLLADDKQAVAYQQIRSGQVVNYQGQDKTLPQLNALLQEPDRGVREEAWRLIRQRLVADYDAINAIFDEMLQLRNQMAANAGFANYRDFAHQQKWRFGYTPADLLRFHDAVEKIIVPLLGKIYRQKCQGIGLESLRPWDINVDKDTKPLQPFHGSDELLDKFSQLLDRLDPAMVELFERMRESNFFDLESRPGKDPGSGFCAPFFAGDAAFILMNATGIHRNMVTLAHEYGHALHLTATAAEPLLLYRLHPAEVGELASMCMEMLTLPHWQIFYPRESDYHRAIRQQFVGALEGIVSHVIIDAFQHWIYTNPGHGAKERAEYFKQLLNRFDHGIDWSGLEQDQGVGWVRIPHIFHHPFYMIEYSFSRLGSLALYRNYLQRPKQTIAEYYRFLQSGYSLSTRQLYELAGIRFDFSEDYLRELAEFLENVLDLD